jgi:hypothetical protein
MRPHETIITQCLTIPITILQRPLLQAKLLQVPNSSQQHHHHHGEWKMICIPSFIVQREAFLQSTLSLYPSPSYLAMYTANRRYHILERTILHSYPSSVLLFSAPIELSPTSITQVMGLGITKVP